MAVAFESATSGQGVSITSLTVATTSSGSDRLLVAVSGNHDYTGEDVTAITYNGVSFFANQISNQSVANIGGALHYRVAPDTVSRDVQVTYGSTVQDIALGLLLFSGVDQTTPIGNTQSDSSASASSLSVTCTGVNTNDMVVDGSATNDGYGTITPGADQTERFQESIHSSASPASAVAGSTQAGADGGVMSETFGFSGNCVIGAAVIKEVAAAGANPKGPLGMPLHGPFGGPVSV